jgi:hypothetical protein
MHPLTVALIVLSVVIVLFAIFFKIPNASKDGGTSTFDKIRVMLVAVVVVVGILYAIFRNV